MLAQKRTSLKVAFLLPHIVMGGVEKVLLEFLGEMQKQRPEWELSVFARKKVTDAYFINFFQEHKIQLYDNYVLTKPKKGIFSKIGYVMAKPIVKKVRHKKLGTDLSKQDVYLDFQFFGYAKEISQFSKPKITWIHGSINYFNKNKKRFLSQIDSYTKMVCLSHSFLKDFEVQYPAYKDKIVSIYNPINSERIQSLAQVDNSKGRYFCVVSRLKGDKDIETVVEAFKGFVQNHQEAKLLIAGEGPKEKELRELAKDCPQIAFLGKIDEPYTLIKNAVAHILSSYSEGLPTVLLENAALGTLSIASNCKSGTAEILLNGEAGFLFEAGNKEELARLMEEVWTGNAEAQQKIACATKNLTRFASDKVTKKVIDLVDCFSSNGFWEK